MLIPGPSKTSFLRKRASSPKTIPRCFASSRFQLAAIAVPGGKEVEASSVSPAYCQL
ncbi:hypothetical protein D3C86_986800 [compost metagenome]